MLLHYTQKRDRCQLTQPVFHAILEVKPSGDIWSFQKNLLCNFYRRRISIAFARTRAGETRLWTFPGMAILALDWASGVW